MTETVSVRDRQEEVQALREQGMTQQAIAEALGLNQSTVSRLLKMDPRAPEMRRLLDQGQSLEMIGKRFDLSKERVRQLVGPRRKPERGVSKHFSLSGRRWEALAHLAWELGYRYPDGSDQGRGNIGLFLDAIATGELHVHPAQRG